MMRERVCILVVEDDPAIAELIQVNLEAAGYSVTVAGDGLAALHALEAVHPTLVTLDLQLPSISGFRLANLFKRLCPETPVLVVTALAFEEAEDSVRAGVDEFFTKHFDPIALVKTVGRYLNRPGARDSPSQKVSRRQVEPVLAGLPTLMVKPRPSVAKATERRGVTA